MTNEQLQVVQGWATVVGSIATTFTFLGLVWYTVETYKLRKAAETQNRLAAMPVVLFQVASIEPRLGEPLQLSDVAVRNVGTGAAFNLRFTPVRNGSFKIEFDSIPVLEVGTQRAVQYTIFQNETTTGFSRMKVRLDSVIGAGQLGSSVNVTVTYLDYSGIEYRSDHTLVINAAAKYVTTDFKGHRTS